MPKIIDDPKAATLSFLTSAIGKSHLPQTAGALNHLAGFGIAQERQLQPKECIFVEIIGSETRERGAIPRRRLSSANYTQIAYKCKAIESVSRLRQRIMRSISALPASLVRSLP